MCGKKPVCRSVGVGSSVWYEISVGISVGISQCEWYVLVLWVAGYAVGGCVGGVQVVSVSIVASSVFAISSWYQVVSARSLQNR